MRSSKRRRLLTADERRFLTDPSSIREDPWLLLRDAVDCAHSPHEWFAVDRNHASIPEDCLEGFGGASVVCVTEYREKYDAVCNVKVCVARRQALEIAVAGARATNYAWHWQGDDLE